MKLHLAMFAKPCLVSTRDLNNPTLSRKGTVDSFQGDSSDYLKHTLEELSKTLQVYFV